jgi:hypothetical protein
MASLVDVKAKFLIYLFRERCLVAAAIGCERWIRLGTFYAVILISNSQCLLRRIYEELKVRLAPRQARVLWTMSCQPLRHISENSN